MVKYLIIAAVGASAVVGIYFYGHATGKQAGRVEQLEKSVQAEKDRKNVDQTVAGLDDYELCVRVGGLPDDCQQLRGVDPATEN